MYQSLGDLAYRGAKFTNAERSFNIMSSHEYYSRFNEKGNLEVIVFPDQNHENSRFYRFSSSSLRIGVNLDKEVPILKGKEVIKYLKSKCPN